MPILNLPPTEAEKEAVLIEFGTGDVDIYPSILPNNMLFFIQSAPKPVDEWGIGSDFDRSIDKGKNSDDVDGKRVVMKFGRIESIDVIIECLTHVKNEMIRNHKDQ